jgi:hypothetical protein
LPKVSDKQATITRTVIKGVQAIGLSVERMEPAPNDDSGRPPEIVTASMMKDEDGDG